MELTKDLNCRICGSNEFKSVYNKNDFHYVSCHFCDVTRLFPYPTQKETEEFYGKYFQIKNAENPVYMSDESWKEFKRIKGLTMKELGIDQAQFKNKNILDIGCATGLFVRYAEEYEAKALGIDISAGLIEIARKNGLNCNCMSLFEIKEKFDIINFSHVIEHVDNPIKYLEYIYSILNNDGSLIIETPCTGLISETFGEDWRFYMPVEHIHLFSQKSLFRILNDKGFAIINWVRFGSGNTSGSIPDINKKVADTIAKKTGIGDTIAVYCKKQ